MKEILVTSSVLIVVILLARKLFRGKVSQKLIYAAWLLVALRLLIPIQFGQSQYSVTTLTEKIENQSKPIQQVQEVLQEPVAGPSRAELYEQLLNEYLQQSADPDLPEVHTPITPEIREQIEEQVDEQITVPTLSELLTAVWIVGMSSMAAWFITANVIYLNRAKQESVPFTEVDASVPVRISPNVPTPCLVGFFRPVIYLTPASVENEQSRNHVLTHELTHLRHWDHIWALVRCLCLCIYWFDPLVWIAASQSRRDCELACDESALKKLGDGERIAYGQTLLATVTQSISPVHLIETPTSMNETKMQLKERVSFIVKKPRNLLIAAICMILTAAITAGCAFTGSQFAEPSVITHGSSAKPGYKYVYLLTEVARYSSDGELYDRTTYTYDEHGKLTVRDCVNYFSDSFSQKITYTRNEQGYLTLLHYDYTNRTDETTYEYKYNDDGTVAAYRASDSDSAYTDYKFEYDGQGRLVKVITKFSLRSYEQYSYCFYDADGRLYKLIDDRTAGTENTYLLSYDGHGHLLRYQRDHSPSINTTYAYDEQGNLIKQTTSAWTEADMVYSYTDGVLTGVEYVIDPHCSTDVPRTYTLDSAGNTTGITWDNGKRTEYKYELVELPDEDADWVLRYYRTNTSPPAIATYGNNILDYFLPKGIPAILTSEDLR